MNSTLCLLW